MDTSMAQILLTGVRSYTALRVVEVPVGTTDEQLQELADALLETLSPDEYELEEGFEWRKFGAKAWIDENGEDVPQYRTKLSKGKWIIRPA